MSGAALALRRGFTRWLPAGTPRPAWLPLWSPPAALRAIRAAVVVPGLFALTDKVVGDLQMATFAAFGGFATLVLASFGGSRRDKLLAHLGLAVVGSALLMIGTAVNTTTWLAATVTLAVTFAVLFGGVAGPNAASGGLAALLAYVLPAASPGTVDMIPSRLEGWWLASAAGTIAVLLLSPRPPGDRLRAAAADSASALADQLGAAVAGEMAPEQRTASIDAKHALMAAFTSTPYRPTGLATTDQALGSLVGLLEWCTSVISDSLCENRDLTVLAPVERDLLQSTTTMLHATAALLRDNAAPAPDFDELDRAIAASVTHLHEVHAGSDGYAAAVHVSFHARTVAAAARSAAIDALITSRRADRDVVADRRHDWFGQLDSVAPTYGRFPRADARLAAVAGATTVAARHASLRSVWFLNSIRGAVALAAAVAVADLTSVQHGFWVVLGTLSVLRSNAASTGSTALRALLGTVLGFAVGGLLIYGIGTDPTALWVTLPIAVFVAAYAPGTASFVVGQAAFTVVVSVLYNLLAPAGWKIGVIRIEDVAIGCGVSLAVGVLFWPRGAAAVVADDLADAFRYGGTYLARAARWALGLGHEAPPAQQAVVAGLRLDDALRGFLAEQGAKRVPKEDMWRLISGTARLRLTAQSLAGLPNPPNDPDLMGRELGDRADLIAGWYQRLAAQLGRPDQHQADWLDLPVLEPVTAPGANLSSTLWVNEHLSHIAPHLAELVEPARHVATQRRTPWWR